MLKKVTQVLIILFITVSAYSASITLTVASDNNMTLAWNTSSGPIPMDIFAQQQGTSCQAYCSDYLGGMSCPVLELYAEFYDDYNALWNQLATCSIVNNQVNWPIFLQVQKSGGNENFPMQEGNMAKLKAKAQKMSYTSPMLIKAK